MDKKDLGLRLRNLRLKANLTQEELAEKVDMSSAYYGEVERGKKVLGIDKFIGIVKALGVSADYILGNELPSGEPYIFDEITNKLKSLEPKQRKTAIDILDGYLKNL